MVAKAVLTLHTLQVVLSKEDLQRLIEMNAVMCDFQIGKATVIEKGVAVAISEDVADMIVACETKAMMEQTKAIKDHISRFSKWAMPDDGILDHG